MPAPAEDDLAEAFAGELLADDVPAGGVLADASALMPADLTRGAGGVAFPLPLCEAAPAADVAAAIPSPAAEATPEAAVLTASATNEAPLTAADTAPEAVVTAKSAAGAALEPPPLDASDAP